MEKREIPKSTLERLPMYLHYLNTLKGIQNTISSKYIANSLKLGEVQVRKDLALVSGDGRPKIGYDLKLLILKIEEILKVNEKTKAVVVGTGKLGQALMEYEGFKEYGISIEAGFDIKTDIVQKKGKPIYEIRSLESYCKENNIEIGIITVPENSAQEICDKLIESGVKGIWNFAPTNLNVSNNIKIKNENMAGSLAILSSLL